MAPRSGGGFYDRFRNRIIFPIFDRQSRVLAFGGRIIGQGEPKYLNSPESQLYHKGRSLYGLPQAAEALRQTGVALVVEGYLDLIALQTHGIADVLASLGTALTREQVRLLKNLASKVVLVYDGDAAGIKAMQPGLPVVRPGEPARAGPGAAPGAGPGRLRQEPRGGNLQDRLGERPSPGSPFCWRDSSAATAWKSRGGSASWKSCGPTFRPSPIRWSRTCGSRLRPRSAWG